MSVHIVKSVSESPAGILICLQTKGDADVREEKEAEEIELLIARDLWKWGRAVRTKDEIDEETFLEMEYRATLSRAIARVRGILSYSGQSRSGLINRLRQYGFSDEICEKGADYAVAHGLICEESQAERSVDVFLHRKYWGRRRIRAELIARGYEKEVVDEAIAAVSQEEFDQSLHMIIRKKYGQPPTEGDEKQKMILSLLRLGYSADEIKNAIASFKR